MSMFALVEAGQVVAYPLTKTDIARRHPQVSFPRGEYEDQLAVNLGYTPVVATEPPAVDIGMVAEVSGCEFVGGDWVQTWQVRPMNEAEMQAAREQWKAERELTVSRITVTTQTGNTFDGDETSQGRMARAIISLEAEPGTTTTWVLADNTVVQVDATEMREALKLAGLAQTAVWVWQGPSFLV